MEGVLALTLKRLQGRGLGVGGGGDHFDCPSGFSKNVSPREKVKPLFFVAFKIILSDMFPENFIKIPQVV